MADTKKILPCILCSGLYSEEDVRKGEYFISTMVCAGCYRQGKKQPHSLWCFGKLTVKKKGKVLYGYDPNASECSSECPDRRICKVFIKLKAV